MLGFAQAVKQYGDNWIMAFQYNSRPHRIAAGQSAKGAQLPDQRDYVLMRCCVVVNNSAQHVGMLPAEFSGKRRESASTD